MIAAAYLQAAPSLIRPRTLREAKRYLEQHWKPLHDVVLDRLDRRSIMARLDQIATDSGATACNRAKAYASMACAWALERGRIDHNPFAGIKRPMPERPCERVLSLRDLAAIWKALDPADTFASIMRLLLLTGQRAHEVAGLRWGEIDFEQGLWVLPADRSKNHRPHTVPLSRQALDLLRGSERDEGDDLVFPGNKAEYRGMGGGKRRLDAALNGAIAKSWTIHDIRRSVATGLAEMGISPIVIEAVLNHVSGQRSGVAGIYNRHSYADEKRTALQAWADRLDAMVSGQETPGNVVALRHAG